MFAIVLLLYYITVTKQPYYGRLKIKLSYDIVLYYVLIQFLYNDGPPTAINSVLALIANSGCAIVVIDREAVEINYFLLYFIDSTETLQQWPQPTPYAKADGGGVCLSIKTMPLEGEMAHHGGDVCELCVLLAKGLPNRSFLFPPEWT